MKWTGILPLVGLIAVGCGSEKGNDARRAWRPSAVLPEGAAESRAEAPQATVAAPKAVDTRDPLEKTFNFKTLSSDYRQYLHATAADKFRASMPSVTDE